ncbi:MAG: endonuclease/exonuclease/phosphatase family protein [Sedimenticola sp.]
MSEDGRNPGTATLQPTPNQREDNNTDAENDRSTEPPPDLVDDSVQKTVKIGMWNISGLAAKINLMTSSFEDFINGFDVICFVETWADTVDQFNIPGYISYAVVRDKHRHAWRNSGGLAVFTKENMSKYCRTTRLTSCSTSKNIIWLKFDFLDVCKGLPVICGFVYLSPENSSVHADEDLFHIMEEDIAKFRDGFPNHAFIIAGDFNAYTNTELDFIQFDRPIGILEEYGYNEDTPLPPRSNQDTRDTNAYGRRLINLCRNTGVRLVNGRYGSDAGIGNFTCITNLSASTIDYILCDDELTSYISDFRVHDRLESIHMPLELNINFNFQPADIVAPGEGETVGLKKYRWKETESISYKKTVEAKMQENSQSFHDSIENENLDQAIKIILDTVYSSSENMKTNSRTKKSAGQNKKKENAWFDEECKLLKARTLRSLRQFRITKTDNSLNEYKQCKNDYKNTINSKKDLFLGKQCEMLEKAAKDKNSKYFWSFLKANDTTNNSIQPEEWLTHFYNVFNTDDMENNMEFNADFDNITNEDLDEKITQAEVRQCIKDLKSGKAP